MSRSFVFFWETEPNKFIFESARERQGDLGKNLSGEDICRKRLREGNKKTFDWSKKQVHVIEITDWITDHPEMFTQAKDALRWSENSILRKQLNAKGYPTLLIEGKEKHQGDVYRAVADINEYLFGTPVAKDFKPKKRTTKRLLKFIKDKHEELHNFDEVLYGATMGAGKTSDWLHACQEWHKLKNKNVHLMVTSMPGTRNDLARDMADGIQFQNMILVVPDKALPDIQYILKDRVIGFSDIKQVGKDLKKNYVISLGVQDARGDDGDKYKSVLKKLSFGIYGKDEVQTNQGEFSQFEKNVVPHIKFDLAIYLTGTPEKFVLEGSKFTDANTILFLANDLYEAQIDGDPDWQGYPWRNFMVLNYKDAHDRISQQLGLTPDQGWTLSKQWAWDKDNHCLVHEMSVTELIKIRFGIGLYADDPRCFWGPGSGLAKYRRKTGCIQIENGDSNRKTIYVAKMIERITGIKAFAAHEKNGYEDWLNFCNNNPDVSSVYVTHDKDMTGKNNKKINYQWLSLSISSSTRIGQALGRGNRKDDSKDNVFYFVDDPETALSATLDPIEATSDTPGVDQTTAEKIHRISSYWFEGTDRWAKGTVPDLVALIQKLDPIGMRGLKSGRHINGEATCPSHLEGTLTSARVSSSVSAVISDIEGSKGSNTLPVERTKAEISDDKLYRQNLQKSIVCLAKALVYSDGVYFDVDSILKNPVVDIEGQELTLEQISKAPLSFNDLKIAFGNNDVSKASVNKSLSVIKSKFASAILTIEPYMNFLGHPDLIDTSTKFMAEPTELVNDYVNSVLSQCTTKSSPVVGDLVGGRGYILYRTLQQASKFDIDIDPAHVYYNDIDPVMVGVFRKVNRIFNLGIPDKNITCQDARVWKNYNTIKFDLGVGNPPTEESGNETSRGANGNVSLYKQISESYPIKFGGVKGLITNKGIIKDLLTDTGFNTLTLNLMTEKHYWSYPTCFWVARREPNLKKLVIADYPMSKIYEPTDNPNWYQNNGKVTASKISCSSPRAIKAIIKLPEQHTGPVYSNTVDPDWEKILYGPKFAATLLHNKHSYIVTTDPLCAAHSGAIATTTIDDANKMRLFVENNKLLPAIHKKLKTRGLFWTLRHLKPFDLSQIVTGEEIPQEWKLTSSDVSALLTVDTGTNT